MKRGSARKRKIIIGILMLITAIFILLTSGDHFTSFRLEMIFAFSLLGAALLFSGFLIP
jgi:hypothetical protein